MAGSDRRCPVTSGPQGAVAAQRSAPVDDRGPIVVRHADLAGSYLRTVEATTYAYGTNTPAGGERAGARQSGSVLVDVAGRRPAEDRDRDARKMRCGMYPVLP
ncbi:hypothetical protein E7Y31_12365 [Candidatus Frankia alpina]|uniref:Uncharacterized protein n=1 Tax=Candidatus Frankia alpina TaxID=2699483 RepID=A0A4S5EQA2_9ACTN|nr:hypothetical protein E7Y31_12365 [Candidatus Frankia alpina]